MDFPRKAGTSADPIFVRQLDDPSTIVGGLLTGARAINLWASMTLGTGLTRDFWANGGTGNQTLGTAALTLEVVSSSTNDAAAGTGARTLLLTGLNASFVEITETVTMNGQTAVVVAGAFMRINSAVVVTTGTGHTNAGTISIRDVSDSPVYAVIPIGAATLNQLHYTVPAGKYALLADLSFSSMGDSDETAPPLEGVSIVTRVATTASVAAPTAYVYKTGAGVFAQRGGQGRLTYPGGWLYLAEGTLLAPQVVNATAANADVLGSALLLEFTA
jgi:hypothetical protein